MSSRKFSASRKNPGRRAQRSFAPGLRLGRRFGGGNASGPWTAVDRLLFNIQRREERKAAAERRYEESLKAAVDRETNARTSWTCQLPPEILGSIFTFVRDCEERNHWVKIGSVCSFWRQVFIDFLTLWCRIDCSHMCWGARKAAYKAIFERSRSLPLHITADFEELVISGNLRSLQAGLKGNGVCSRIQTLALHNLVESCELETMFNGLQMPHLTEASFTMQYWDVGEASVENLPATIETLLTAASGLSRISFKGCLPAARLSSILSPTLTHITLMAYPRLDDGLPDDKLPGVDDIIEVLAVTQNLCHLHLRGMPARRSYGSAATLPGGVCELPPCFLTLKYDILEYGEGHACALDFMSCLKLPAGAELNLNLHQDSGSLEQEITELTQIIVAAQGTFDCNDPSWSVCLTSQSVRIDLADPQPHSRSTASSSITVRRMAGLSGGNVSGILRHLSLGNLIHIEFNRESAEYCLSGNNSCIDQLLVARQVRDVVVELPVDSDVVYALERTYNNHSQFLFPNLRTVTVLKDCDVDDTAEEVIEGAIAVLGTVCTVRADRGYPMPTLRIDKGYQRLVPTGLESEVKVDFIPSDHRTGDH
ncbi:hypothetical protein PENSPDRAFT_758213 [Peniophora sp. CONT]|nr:hypothetical protein PENSPDRAFT_758213 [Peniophora sp. CONT]